MDELNILNRIDSILEAGGDHTEELRAKPLHFFPAVNPEDPDGSFPTEATPHDTVPERVSDDNSNHKKEEMPKVEMPEDTILEEKILEELTPEKVTAVPSNRRSKRLQQIADEDLPREKALRLGVDALTDSELIAILLGSGTKEKSVIELAQEILHDNDNRLAYLSRKSIPWLMKRYKGLGLAKATILAAAVALGGRAQASLAIKDLQLSSSESVYSCMRSQLERINHEEFWVLHLSRANRLQSKEQISKGGQFQTSVDVKLIAKSVIDRLSAAIILVHNHPSGNMTPSVADDQLTRRIVDVCKLVDVPVLDHVIVGPSGYYSYRDNGKL